MVQLKDRTSTTIVPVAPNRRREEHWLRWMMIGLCGVAVFGMVDSAAGEIGVNHGYREP